MAAWEREIHARRLYPDREPRGKSTRRGRYTNTRKQTKKWFLKKIEAKLGRKMGEEKAEEKRRMNIGDVQVVEARGAEIYTRYCRFCLLWPLLPIFVFCYFSIFAAEEVYREGARRRARMIYVA